MRTEFALGELWIEQRRPPRRVPDRLSNTEDSNMNQDVVPMDGEKLAHAISALRDVGVEVDMNGEGLADPNTFLDKLISACHKQRGQNEVYTDPHEPDPIQMSLGTFDLGGRRVRVSRPARTEEVVDGFFNMLPGGGRRGA